MPKPLSKTERIRLAELEMLAAMEKLEIHQASLLNATVRRELAKAKRAAVAGKWNGVLWYYQRATGAARQNVEHLRELTA